MYWHLAGDITSSASSPGYLGGHAPSNDRGGPGNDRGIIVVHCGIVSMPRHVEVTRTAGIHTLLHALIGADNKVEVGSIAETAPENNFTLQLKDRDACSVELHAGGLFLRLELEEDRGCHVDCRGLCRVTVVLRKPKGLLMSARGRSSAPAADAVRRLSALQVCFAQSEWEEDDLIFLFLFLQGFPNAARSCSPLLQRQKLDAVNSDCSQEKTESALWTEVKQE